MTDRNEDLLFTLLRADTEAEVVAALRDAGYWDDDDAWRYYNDDPNNFDRAGNQQRNPEAALVEKIVNSVDANLLRRAIEAGIDPRAATAPGSPREAVAIFYEGATPGDVRAYQGSLAAWTNTQLRNAARDITVAMTGRKPEDGYPSITVADAGESQAPERLPKTILSLSQGIKKGVPFVQGRFNMGGTGALRFCGTKNLQLVLSKRLPAAAAREAVSTAWGFTIVRRDDPSAETRISTYRYLAPIGAAARPRNGDLLTVDRDMLPIFPEGQRAYSREAAWGTLIKLYEYKTRARTHMFRKGGLQERLDILLPGLVLPVRLHECREYRGEERSFETTLTGLEVRLDDREGKATILEDGFPTTGKLTIRGQDIPYSVYAFRQNRADTYKRNEGILFVLGGQTHAAEPDRFFRRKDVGMSYLAPSLLAVLDCSRLVGRTIEDLFMNSRDRLADEELAHDILDDLAADLRKHPGLERLREQRRQADIANRLANERPLQDVLQQILRRSPALARIFLAGDRLSNPFASESVQAAGPFIGKKHPTYFRFKGQTAGTKLARHANLGQRFRLTFETDAENGYFRRAIDPGDDAVEATHNGVAVDLRSGMNLVDGYAHLSVTLPEGAKPGDSLSMRVTVTDPVITDPFVNEAVITIDPEIDDGGGGGGERRRRKPPNPRGEPQPQPSGIQIPEVQWVRKEGWQREDFVRPMNESSGMRAVLAKAQETADEAVQYDFYVNADNVFLQTELKATKEDPEVVRAKFKYGMALIGMGALRRANEVEARRQQANDGGKGRRETRDDETSKDDGPDAEDLVADASDVLAPMLLPMIDGLGGLQIDAVGSDTSADAQDLAEAITDD